ncbi:hypothetical protein J7J95_01870 [bacterium]|nr:hypothetical protein [bacterium]
MIKKIFAGLLVVLFLIVGGLVWKSRGEAWDKKTQFNLVLAYPQKTVFLVITPQQKSALAVVFPSSVRVEAFGGYGTFRLDKIDDLGRQEGKRELLRKTIQFSFGFPVDFYHSFSSPFSQEESFALFRKQLMKLVFSWQPLSLSKRITLWEIARFLQDRFLVKELIFAEEKGFLSGENLKRKDWLTWKANHLSDPLLREEGVLIGIYNCGGETGLGKKVAHALSGVGMNVAVVKDSQREVKPCLVLFSSEEKTETKTVRRLHEFFDHCQWRRGEGREFGDGVDVAVFLGKGF